MANVLSLALRVTADAKGLNLSPVQRALVGLGDQADKLTSQFDQFAAGSGAAAAAQADFAARSQELINTLRDNGSATQFAAAFEKLNAEARELAVAFAEGQRVTEANRTEEEKRAITLAKLNDLVAKGAIDQETFNRASAEASGANAEAARAAGEAARVQAEAAKVQSDALRQRQALESRAASIINANLTAQERYEQSLRELNDLQRQGLLTQEQYNRAVAAARKPLDDAAAASARVAEAGKESALQFNELSGVFAILPGSLGNIAGRLSGLTSAGEGLSRVFAGGLQQGIASIGQTVAGLINPFTIAAAGVVAFAAGAAAVARGLIDLEDRVERLSRLATQLGVSFEFVQTLEEAGKRADVSIEQLSGSFARLQNTLAGADEESKKAATALERLGVSVTEFGELSQEQQIELIGEKLSQIEDPAERSAAAIALFGRSGVQLLPFFNELELAASDMERFGRAVTDLDQQRLADFGGGLDALNLASTGLGTSLLLPFTGLAEGISFALAEVIAGITAIVDPIGRILEPLLTQIGRNIEFLGTQLGNVGRVIGAVFEPFADIVQEVFVALEPLLDGILDFLKGVSDAAVATVEWFIAFTPVGQIAENVGALGETISRVVTIITTAFSLAGEVVSGLVARFSEFISQSPVLEGIGNVLSSIFGTISGVFSSIASAIGGVVGRLLTLAENFLGIDRSAQQAAESAKEVMEIGPPEGFENFDKAINKSRESLNSAIEESAEFGQVGFDAALQFQESLARLQEQAEDGILNEEAYNREVQRVTESYREQIDTIKAAEEESRRRTESEIANVNKLIEASEQQQRIANEFGGSDQRFQAAQNLAAIENEIARVEEQQRAARAAGDTAAADAATARLASLDQVAARERDIASGAAEEREAAAKAADDLTKKLFAEAQKRADAEVAAREKIEEAQAAFRERQFEVDLARLEELNTVRTGSVEVADIRSGGIGAFFATLREDPAVSEAKKQTAELTKLNKNIEKLEAQRVDILAGTG
jgi:hypothetical protein